MLLIKLINFFKYHELVKKTFIFRDECNKKDTLAVKVLGVSTHFVALAPIHLGTEDHVIS